MNNLSKRVDDILMNFQAKKLKYAMDKIEDLSYELAIHTTLVLLYPNDKSINHWKYDEIIPWLIKMKSYNNVKTRSGKLGSSDISKIIYADPLGEYTDIKLIIQRAVSHYNENKDSNKFRIKKPIAPNKVDISNYDLDNFRISLGAIYDDYVDFISDKMDLNELKDRVSKYYLYDG